MLKKIMTFLLISFMLFSIMLSACSFSENNSANQNGSDTPSYNGGSSCGGDSSDDDKENDFYDDGGKYDEKEDTYIYDFDDSITSKNVYFSNEKTEIAFSQYSEEQVTEGKLGVKENAFSFSYVSADDYQSGPKEITLPENYNEYLKISCDDTKSNPIFSLQVYPTVSSEDFCKADYISFCVYFKDKTSSDAHTTWTNVLELYFSNSNSELLPAKTGEWIEVILPLSLYKTAMTSDSKLRNVNSLSKFYDYLKENVLFNGKFLKNSNISLDTCQYDLFITDMRLKIMSVKDTLDRNLTDLSEKNGSGQYVNTFPNWAQPTEELNPDRGWRYIKRYSGEGSNPYYRKIFVVPQKTEKQLDFYDYVKITMFIETDIKYAFTVSSDIPTKTGKTNKIYATISANKWVEVFIPIEDAKALYPHLLTSTFFHKHASPIYAIMPFIQCAFVVDGISSLNFSSKNISDLKNAGKISSDTQFSVLIDTILLVKRVNNGD